MRRKKGEMTERQKWLFDCLEDMGRQLNKHKPIFAKDLGTLVGRLIARDAQTMAEEILEGMKKK